MMITTLFWIIQSLFIVRNDVPKSALAFRMSYGNKKTPYLFKPILSTGEEIYKTKCAMCHNGKVAESPRFESLQLLSSRFIVETLTKGVMQVQGATLTKKERQLVADFISKTTQNKTPIALGNCTSTKEMPSKNQAPSVNSWGMGLNNKRFLDDKSLTVNAHNASSLTLKWAFAFPDATRARVQPTILGNTLFTASQHGLVYALDKNTGCVQWTFQAESEIRSTIVIGTDKNGVANRLYFSDFKAIVYALDIQKRQLLWRRKVDNHEQATITGTLVCHKNRLYVPVSSTEILSAYSPKYACCTFRGSVVSLDANTGKVYWKTYTTDEPTPQGVNAAGSQRFGPSGAPVWSSPTIDVKRNVLYIGTGENYSRPASNTSDAILAMSLETGAIKWVRQTVAQDSWNAGCVPPIGANCPDNHGPDYDFGAPPILINRVGKPDLLLAGQKSGMVYALDPDADGKIIWQTRVGRGGIMGGIHWGMAANNDTLFVPINDREAWPEDTSKPAYPGLHALRIDDGKTLWSKIEPNRCGDAKWSCGSGLSAAITLLPDVVLGASLDGMFRVYAAKDGKTLWEFDTNQAFTTVNGQKGFGGTIDSAGPVVVGNQVFINSGYAKFNEKAGNVLLAFEIKPTSK
jgi:polyvinyl alcohol dehydrogenase (cytochrome)